MLTGRGAHRTCSGKSVRLALLLCEDLTRAEHEEITIGCKIQATDRQIEYLVYELCG
jgi:hypothetical protein